MSRELKRRGYAVGRHKARSLMRLLGVEAIYPRKRLSIPDKEHQIYPYLLRDVTIDRPDVAWAADITYIRLKHGFVYLVAVMDIYSRYIVSWRISTTLETDFCCEALREALRRGRPEYFNTDQGAQFTSKEFTSILARMSAGRHATSSLRKTTRHAAMSHLRGREEGPRVRALYRLTTHNSSGIMRSGNYNNTSYLSLRGTGTRVNRKETFHEIPSNYHSIHYPAMVSNG